MKSKIYKQTSFLRFFYSAILLPLISFNISAQINKTVGKIPLGAAEKTGTLNEMNEGSQLSILSKINRGKVYNLGLFPLIKSK